MVPWLVRVLFELTWSAGQARPGLMLHCTIHLPNRHTVVTFPRIRRVRPLNKPTLAWPFPPLSPWLLHRGVSIGGAIVGGPERPRRRGLDCFEYPPPRAL